MITTAIGNYPKTPNTEEQKLRQAYHKFDNKQITLEQLQEVEREVTREAIDEQVATGIDVVTDGQIRWMDEITYVAGKLGGVELNGLVRFIDTNTYYRQPLIKGEISWKGEILVEDFKFAKEYSKKKVKAVLTGPYTLAKLSKDEGGIGLENCVIGIATALNKEAKALEEAGADFIQINEPEILRNSEDWNLFESAVGKVFEGVKVKSALYTYFGDVKEIYPQMLELPVAVIGFDFWRGNAFEILGKSEFGKELGAGIVDARNTKMESKELLTNMFAKCKEIAGEKEIYVSPNCGLDFLPRERANEKLANMVKCLR